jgi:hypothetical protein
MLLEGIINFRFKEPEEISGSGFVLKFLYHREVSYEISQFAD